MAIQSTRLDPTRQGPTAAELLSELERRVVGQSEAVRAVVDAFAVQAAGLNAEGRPLASFLLLGPTGTGKTRLVEALAQTTLGNSRAVVKIDCAEFQHGHEIAKLVGSPPGYLGHRETHALLDQDSLNRHHTENVKVSFVLFDEIEKASDTLWTLLLGILDKATLTLGDNRRVDFSRAMIFLTSNLGAKEIEKLLGPQLGFAQTQGVEGIVSAGLGAARRKFTPEFLNRLDNVVVFRPLGQPELRQILHLELQALQERVVRATMSQPDFPHFVLHLSDPAREWLVVQGTDAKYGARFLKRTLEQSLMKPIVNLVTSKQLATGDVLSVDLQEDKLTFSRESFGASV